MRSRVKRGEIHAFEAAKSRSPEPVKLGSYYRVLGQARRNFERSIFTVLLGLKTQNLRREDLVKLLNMVADAPEDMGESNLEEFAALLSVLVEKLVVT